MILTELVLSGITLYGPELVTVPIDAVELCDAPTVPGALTSSSASPMLDLFVTAFWSLGSGEHCFRVTKGANLGDQSAVETAKLERR